ncbi:MAG: hypothetical protein U0821_01115 [Chloroflexota bacterium]
MSEAQEKGELRLTEHFSVLVYPFVHGAEGPSRERRLRHLAKFWRPWWQRLPTDHARTTALDDTFFFLPRIRELLFPEAATQVIDSSSGGAATADRLNRLSIVDLLPLVPEHAVLRLTLLDERLDELRRLRLDFKRKDDAGQSCESFGADVAVEWVDIALFPQRVGFLAIRLRLDEEQPSIDRLNAFHRYARLVHPPAVGWVLARWSRRVPQPTAETDATSFESRDLVDFLLQRIVGAPDAHVCPKLSTFLGCLNHSCVTSRYSDSADGQIYGQASHVYAYVCLATTQPLTDRAPAVVDAPAAPPAIRSVQHPPEPPFESPAERLLYGLATCTDMNDPAFIPHHRVLDAMRERSLIALWQNWQGLALHDNAAFLAFGASDFTTGALLHNVESDYFHLYLLALFQWTRLSIMSGELVRQGAREDLDRDLKAVRRLLDQFMMLQNRYWFREVSRRPQGLEIYRRFQQGLDVSPLYDEVEQHLRDLAEYYDRRADRRLNSLLTFLTLIVMPLSLTVDLYGNALFQVGDFDWGKVLEARTFWSIPITFVALAGAIGLLWLFWYVLGPGLGRLWRAIWTRIAES